MDGLAQSLRRRRARAVHEHDVGHRGRKPIEDLLGDLTEDLLLRIEVVVEGSVRQAGALGDVGDARLEETVLLEDLLGGVDEPGAGLYAFPRPRAVWLVALDLS